MTLALFHYNNYYNRIVKKKDTLDEYGVPLHMLYNANFNPNDGITAEHVFNYPASYEDAPDYMLVLDTANNIISRWYVIESNRTAGGQFKVSLYRDVIADW